MKVKWGKLLKKSKALYLAYDQGMEHGPSDFDDKNVNPLDIISIARKGKFTGLIVQKGIAEKYYAEIKKSKVGLIVKLNGKTNLHKGEPISRQLCSVEEAVALGAKAVGYTVYIGSEYEDEMLQEFEKIIREAHAKGIPVIAWIYPRGKGVKGRDKGELMAYAARVGLEIGADMVKLNYYGKEKDLKWAVENAGRTKVVIAGGIKKTERELIKQVKEIMAVGCVGIAIGRNVWQAKNSLKVAEKIRKIIFREKKILRRKY